MNENAWLLFDSDVCVSHPKDASDFDPGYETDAERPHTSQQPLKQHSYTSSSLPFGQHVPLVAVEGDQYLTAQTLIQQVSYLLSDKIFSYSPETFDLDRSLAQWTSEEQLNALGYQTGVTSMETRSGAGSIALGYMFSKEFDLEKRHIPQSIVASTATLRQLRPALDQLALLYNVANPVVAHISATEYSAASSTGLVTDYTEAMTQAEDLGLGLLASTSTFEAQHMSLLATILAQDRPSVHIYDGVNVGRETTRVLDVLGRSVLFEAYQNILAKIPTKGRKHLNSEGKLMAILDAFNDGLGTDYKPFEYYGHAEPESVLVVFGSVEGSIAAQLAFAMSQRGVKVGAINVRVYRPFVEDEFIATLPSSVKSVAVLGQVKDKGLVEDSGVQSLLYRDVVATLSLSNKFRTAPAVIDMKYAREEVWTPSKLLFVFQHLDKPLEADERAAMASPDRPRFDLLGPSVQRFTFWDADDSVNASVPAIVGQAMSSGTLRNVQSRTGHDNLAQGGTVRTDLRSSEKSIEAPYSVTNSNVTFVGEEKLLSNFDILGSSQNGSIVLVKLPGSKGQDNDKIEKRFPAAFRKGVVDKQIQLFVLDPTASSKVTENGSFEPLLTQIAILSFVSAGSDPVKQISLLASINGNTDILQALFADLKASMWRQNAAESWSAPIEERAFLPADITVNGLVGFDKTESEPASYLKSWIQAAKGMVFKEATGTNQVLRPDLGVKTSVVHVKERRRLTPKAYDRNIFHIEFDLGTSGLKYAIGEALGIHPENDPRQVQEFIDWYGLNSSDVVEVPSREDSSVLENRTVYQSLLQNIDIFGRPPKRFYEALSEFASEEKEATELLALGTGANQEATQELKRRAEVDTITYADVLLEFSSAHPSFHDIVRLVAPIKRREYSIASSQKVTPKSVSLLIVTVGWVDPKGRDRFGQATRYLNSLQLGTPVTVSVKPSVMKLPQKSTAPLIMAGLGTGLAPFRAFVQERAWQKQQGMEIGQVLLYMGARHQREEYLYGEEWEAYQDAGIITLLGRAFSRDQPEKIYIQDRMRQTLAEIRDAYLKKEGSFYLCGPTWPVPDVTEVLQEAVEVEGRAAGKKVDGRKEIERMKEEERYVLEVY